MEDLKKGFLVRGDNIVGALGDKYFTNTPLGTVLSFAGQTAPHGYLLCDGASYKVADYKDLYAVIGNTYGGDTENFNVPNLVDKFIQGSNTSGTEKEAGLPNIEGSISNAGATQNDQFLTDSTSSSIKTNGALSIAGYANKTSMANGTDSFNTPTGFKFDASKSNAIYGNSDTVQPPALTMVYIIKAFHTNEGVDSGVSDDVVDYVEGEIAEVESKITSTYLVKDILAGDENVKTVSFKVRKDYFSQYYAKRTFLLSTNVYSLGFSKPVIGLVEVFRGSADNYDGYVINLQDSRYTGVTVTVNGDYLEVAVTFNSYESSGCMVSCSSLSNVPIA